MKLKKLLLATLTAGALLGGSLQSNAQLDFTVDPGQNWLGYINVFDQADNFQFGFGEGTPSTASANWAPGPAQPLTMSPNTRLYDENVADPFWVDQITFEANKVVEANFYQEVDGLDGQDITFGYDVLLNTLPAGYSAQGFIKVLDAGAGWATVQSTFADLTPGGAGLSLTVGAAIDPRVQAGFYVKGVAITATDPDAILASVFIVPEPTTFALAGLGAAALLIFRRRS